MHWLRTTCYCLPDAPSPARPPTRAPQLGAAEYEELSGFVSEKRGKARFTSLSIHTALAWPCPLAQRGDWHRVLLQNGTMVMPGYPRAVIASPELAETETVLAGALATSP